MSSTTVIFLLYASPYSRNSWQLLYLHQLDPYLFLKYFDLIVSQSQHYDYLRHMQMCWDCRLQNDPLQEVLEVIRFLY